MKGSLFMAAWVCSTMLSLGQGSVKGSISDGHLMLPGVTVLLLDGDSAALKAVVTDTAGTFLITNVIPGSYHIAASMVGYAKRVSPLIEVVDREVIVPVITLEELTTELGEIVVSADRQLFDQKTDRLIINMESSITSSGNTILEVLQKAPGIVVNKQNNSISLHGKSGVRVMMNDKAMELSPEAVVQMLEGMNASNVERIELITAPPAKYDAGGNAGIIHIVTKRHTDFGTLGSLGFALGARHAEALGANLNITQRRKKVAFSLDYAVTRNHNLHQLNMDWRAWKNESVTNYSYRENLTVQQNLHAGFEWMPGRNTKLSLLFTGYRRDWSLDADTDDSRRLGPDSTILTDMNIVESNIWESTTGSIGLQSKIGERSELSFTLDYLYYNNDNPSTYRNTLLYEPADVQHASTIDLNKSTPIRFYVGKVDYQHRLSPYLSWETGIKRVSSILDNNVIVQREANGTWVTDALFTSFSRLNEQLYAAYVSATGRHRGWLIDGGIRYEYTRTVIGKPGQKDLLNRYYDYLFPTLTARKMIDDEKDIQFSYVRRITRPTYNDIAPYVFFWGPSTFSAGNTALYPAIADAVTAVYHVRQWNMSVQFSHVGNEIVALQPEVDILSGNLTFRSQNLRHLNTLGLTNAWSFSPNAWWDVQTSFTLQYQEAKTEHLANDIRLTQYGLNINLVNLFRLPNDFSIEISGMYQSKSLSGISHFSPMGSLNAGIQKSFAKAGTIRLSMDDILYTNYWRIKTYSPENDLDSHFRYDWHNQYIRLTYSRSLGNRKLRLVKVGSGSEEERGRVGN